MAVRQIDGVSQMTGDVDTRTVIIAYDEEKASLERIKDALARGGYPAIEEE